MFVFFNILKSRTTRKDSRGSGERIRAAAVELKINGYNALTSINLSNHYTRRTTYSPEEYFDMINPDDYDAIVDRYNDFDRYEMEFNNE